MLLFKIWLQPLAVLGLSAPRKFLDMSLGHCSCPDCGTTLRIRDRSFVGRIVPCPECRVALIIELDRAESLIARKPPREVSRSLPRETNIEPLSMPDQASQKWDWLLKLHRAAGSPLVMAWALGLAVTILIVVGMLRPTHRFQPPSRPMRPADAGGSSPQIEQSAPETDSHSQPAVELADSPAADAINPANAPEVKDSSSAPLVEDGTDIKPVTNVTVKAADSPPAPPPVRIDFENTLKQPLVLFEQSKPVSRRELIEVMEELVGAPIRYDAAELGEKNLDKPVTFKVENTTLAGVLKTILEPAGWVFVTEETQLRVKLKPPQ